VAKDEDGDTANELQEFNVLQAQVVFHGFLLILYQLLREDERTLNLFLAYLILPIFVFL